MRKKQNILDAVLSFREGDKKIDDKEVDFYQKLCFLEVLIDIRDLLEDIKFKK